RDEEDDVRGNVHLAADSEVVQRLGQHPGDEEDYEDGKQRREVEAADRRQDAPEGTEDRIDDDAQPADDRVPRTDGHPGYEDARQDEDVDRAGHEVDDAARGFGEVHWTRAGRGRGGWVEDRISSTRGGGG